MSQGLALGQGRVLAELGVKDLAELRALVEAGRKTPPTQPPAPAPADVSQHPEYRKIGAELGETQARLKQLESEHQRLGRMADEARRAKVRALFLAGGSGEAQADDAVALFHDRFEMSPEGELSTLGRLKDGSAAPLGQKPAELVAELLKARPYLVAPRPAGGVGVKVEKSSGSEKAGGSLWGSAAGESALDRRLGRGKK